MTYFDGSIHNIMFHKANFITEDNDIHGIVGVMLDITEQKSIEKELLKQVNLDSLTGLFNRHYLYQALEQAEQRCRMNQSGLAVFFLDIDGFKMINDTYGHAVGDKLLINISKKIKNCVHESDVVARFGGDEFVIVIENIKCNSHCELLAQNIIDTISQKVAIDGLQLQIGVSIGISSYHLDDENKQDLLINSDKALYLAKSQGRGRYVVLLPQGNSYR